MQGVAVLTDRITDACLPHRQHLAKRCHLQAAGVGSQALQDALAAGLVVRVRRGVYAPRELPPRAAHLVSGGSPDPAYVAHVRAVLMSLGPTAMAGGRTAAVLWGFDMLVEPTLIEVVTADSRTPTTPRSSPRSRHDRRGVVITRRRGAIGVDNRVLGLEALTTLSAVDTVIDCALTRPLREAVVIADSALRSGRVDLAELQGAISGYARHARGPRLRRVLSLVDPLSGSVLETVLRVLLHQHGLRPEAQVVLRTTSGAFLGRVDFLFREQRLVIECDGRRWHDPADARARDRARDNELERARWRLIRVSWADVVHHPEAVVELVRDCLAPWPAAA